MENLLIILVTVLITLLSSVLIATIVYLLVVVRKLNVVVKQNENYIIDIYKDIDIIRNDIYNVKDEILQSLNCKCEGLEDEIVLIDKKIDKRCDKLFETFQKNT
jgi:Na+-transporting NADH:ubiquinone oxidoreductase subunit NqrC